VRAIVPADNQLTRGRAVAAGLLSAACGLPTVLGALGVLPVHASHDVPAWMGAAAGSVFLLAAVLLFADAAAGGANPDGSLPASAPPVLRAIQSIAGVGVVGTMGAMLTWIAFGRGERHFTSTIVLPFIAYRSNSGELPGRIAFGIGALLIWTFMIAGTVVALKRHIARLRAG
jgi:hypothetical protein